MGAANALASANHGDAVRPSNPADSNRTIWIWARSDEFIETGSVVSRTFEIPETFAAGQRGCWSPGTGQAAFRLDPRRTPAGSPQLEQ